MFSELFLCVIVLDVPLKGAADTTEILHVKGFLIINAGPPYWQNSRLPRGRPPHFVHSPPWIILGERTQRDTVHAWTHTHTHARMHTLKVETRSGQTHASVLTYLNLIKYIHTHVRMHTHAHWWWNASRPFTALTPVGKHTESQYLCKNVTPTNLHTEASVPSHTLPCSCCILTDTHIHTHIHTHTLHQTHNGSLSTHGPFAVFLPFSVFRPAVSGLSVCSVARQTAPPPPPQ